MNELKARLIDLNAKLAIRYDCSEESALLQEIIGLQDKYILVPKTNITEHLQTKVEKHPYLFGAMIRTLTFKLSASFTYFVGDAQGIDLVKKADENLKEQMIYYLEKEESPHEDK